MDNDTALLMLGIILNAPSIQARAYLNSRRRKPGRGRGQRRWWVHPLNRVRREEGAFDNLFRKIYETDHEEFFDLTRMLPHKFDQLVELVSPFLIKRSIRKALSTEFRVAVTLSYLAHGDSVRSKSWEFLIGKCTAHKLIPETCRAIWCALQPTYLPAMDRAKWSAVAEGFLNRWQFPDCIGAVDGKHVRIRAPPRSESNYFCYTKYFSLLLMDACDANYKFTWVDIGQYGSISDCSLWNNCDFGKLLEEGKIDLPPPKNLPGTDIATCSAFIGDEAFPLKSYMMRPYSGRQLGDSERVFNYRLCRARRVIENAFGILVSRWQVLSKVLCSSADNVCSMVQAMVCLHNFLMSDEGLTQLYCPDDLVDHDNDNHESVEGEWRQVLGNGQLHDVPRLGANNARGEAVRQRDLLRDYFISPAGEQQTPWQYAQAFRGLAVNFGEDVEADESDDESD